MEPTKQCKPSSFSDAFSLVLEILAAMFKVHIHKGFAFPSKLQQGLRFTVQATTRASLSRPS
jgi:hypothetical protein